MQHRIPRTLVCNWQEDHVRSCSELDEFLKERERGHLHLQRHKRKLDFHHSAVDCTNSGHGLKGRPVHLENQRHRLAVDLNEELTSGVLSAAQKEASAFRTAIRFLPVQETQDLLYGEDVIVSLCNPLRHLRLTLQQTACSSESSLRFVETGSKDSHWQIHAADPCLRELSRGQPVAAESIVVVQHSRTGLMLYLGHSTKENDFGSERVVEARAKHTAQRRGVCQLLAEVMPTLINSQLDGMG